MEKQINIEEALYPEIKKNTLVADKEGTLKATIIDDELDAIECTFNGDDGVQLNTEGYSYLSLSKKNLYLLIKLINRAEKEYNKIDFDRI